MLDKMYDGKRASEMTKDELLKAILSERGVLFDDKTLSAMDEAFRFGYLRGEQTERTTTFFAPTAAQLSDTLFSPNYKPSDEQR